VRFYGFPDEAVAYYQNTGVVADLTLAMERLFKRIHYLGPLRGYPKRSYLWSGEVPESVGWRGERAIEALLAARSRKITRGFKKRSQPFEKVIARWLHEMELVESFRAQPIAKHRKDYEIRVKTHRNRSEVNLTDVGFGLSQVLPVIVQCFYPGSHSIVLFEKPEIHLHPRVQASLADLFIEAIIAREDRKDRNLQLLVESHSEHFLRRLQRRIAEEVLSPEQVAIYFCEPGLDGSVIHELDVDLFGNIRNWPENFFGDEMGELTAMAEASIQRQQRTAPRT
jgi:predicted ATPase